MLPDLTALAGTPQGAQLATVLALVSAVSHAFFGALQKGRHDPWLTRGMIDFWTAAFAAPVALFVVPWPEPWLWPILLGALALHFSYKFAMAKAYSHAAYTVVYPVVRGSGTAVTVLAAMLIFGEHYNALQWLGVACLSGGILALSALNLAGLAVGRRALMLGLVWALAAGVMVAAYTNYDAWGIRATADPFTFLAWFFLITSLDFPVLAALRQRGRPRPPALGNLVARGVIGAFTAYFSFGGVMMATRLDKVGEAAVLRETSTVFAALIGWAMLGERVGPARAALMGVIALGAVIVEFAGR